ncbi:MAG: hypothetical protein QF824_04980 [Candidatus Woesearchaeota archaeon]|jgi:hypothetical protein|nr:hypothetical protein [Candidatus Woesearchaeota archaeon]
MEKSESEGKKHVSMNGHHESRMKQNRELLFGSKVHKKRGDDEKILGKFSMVVLGIAFFLMVFNQYQINSVSDMFGRGGSSIGGISHRLNLLSGKGGVIIGPQLNPDGRTTKLVEWPTISEVPKPGNTGDPTQDAINYIIPTGVPPYVHEGPGSELLAGISFDEPIPSQQIWASLTGSARFAQFGSKIELSHEEEERWQKLTGVFTCEYCCGGPSQVTTISRCGCAHAYAWKGIARFFVRYYGDKADEEILGEMTRWKGLWYPKGMIQDYLVYTGHADASTLSHGGSAGIAAQFAGQGGGGSSASVSELNDLPGMVGGC